MTRTIRLAAAVVGTGVLGVSAVALVGAGGGGPELAGANQLADTAGGRSVGIDWAPVDWSLDEVAMGFASDLAPGDGRVYLLFDGTGGEEGVVAIDPDGRPVGSGMARVAGPSSGLGRGVATAVGLGSRGEVAVASDREVWVFGYRWMDHGYNTALQSLDIGFDVGAVGFLHRNEVLLGSAEEGVIDVASMEPGSFDVHRRRLLGGPGDETAAVQTEEALGSVRAIAPLDDGTVAFVTAEDDGNRLHVIAGDTVREVDTGGVNPVAAEDVDMDGEPRRDRWPMAPISAVAGGRVLAVGEHEGHPRITLVNPLEGEVEVLADLEGVEPTVEERVSAGIVGDDLFFLAEGSLWKKDSVVPG